MAEAVEIPSWLKNLPLAPEYRPTETEFADPIAFISSIEREASAFGICKVIPPLPRPSKKYVLANLKRSLVAHPDHPSPSSASADPPIFTTRHQELGVRRGRALPVQKQVWQSGEFYTLDQFEAKAKAFSRTQLGGFKEVNPLLIETLFWKSAAEKPVYVEYANDVPGSGFGVPEEPFRYCLKRRRKQKRGVDKASVELPNRPFPKKSGEHEAVGASGWKLSNCPWNLQVIARSPGSLTRFMPDEVPGVTSPMVYIGMLFSWFAWHVEDHELHSLNFLHMGSPKTWYAVPGEHASTLEEIVRVQGYGGNVDRLAAFIMLGEKTTLLSPEVLLASRVPCCRLVQHPGEFVVTFPRAYHVGFSHGFNCGEAANFATPKWLMVAKQAAIRRAAMNFLPMLSHQQLLYLLSISFITSVPREQLPGARSSRLRDRKKEEREILVKKAFLDDMMNENNLLLKLLTKATIMGAVLWEPELLPSTSLAPQTHSSFATTDDLIKAQCEPERKDSLDHKGEASCTQDPHKSNDYLRRKSPDCTLSAEAYEDARADCINEQAQEDRDADEIDLPFGLNVDSGSLACVACGILGYPFMAILQPSERASKKLFALNIEESNTRPDKLPNSCVVRQIPCSVKSFGSEEKNYIDVNDQRNEDSSADSLPENIINMSLVENLSPSGQCSSHAIGDLIDKKVDISRCSDLTEAERLSSVCLSTVTNLSNEKQLLNTMDNQVCELSSQEQDDPCVQVERSCSSCSYEMKYDNLRGQHSYNETKEPPQHASMKNNAEVNCKLCLTEFPGTISANEANKLRVPEARSSDEISNWNRSSGFLRPRIFCLQHALVAEDLLQCNGGARMLIICHSDYLKIKALAISIAEEINVQFDCGDISLVGASSSDLGLINISIDEEGHEENGDDWTSKLGLNLKYCVKLKKETPSNQEHLALSMGEIFSDPTVSAVSNIKWLSRKSRTPYKVVGVIQSRSQFYAKTVKSEPIDKNTDSITDSAKVRKVHRNCMSSRHPGLPMSSTFKESCSGNKTAMVDAGDGRCKYGLTSKDCNQRVADIIENLHTVPIEIAEYPQKHLIDWVTLEVRTYSEVVSSRSSHHLPASEKSDAGYSEGSPDIHSNRLSWREAVCGSTKSACNLPCQISDMSEEYEEAHGSNNKISRCDGPDIPVGASILESENFEDLQLVLDKPNLDEFVGNKGPACESGRRPLLEKLDNIEIQLQNKLAVEEASGDDMFADPAAKLEGRFENNILRGYKMQQKFSEGTEHIDDDINVLRCDNQILAVNNSEILQEIPCTDQMEGNALSDHCVKADTQTLDCSLKLTETVSISVTESSAMQEAVENAIDLCVSTESSFSLVNDKDDFIKADVQTASNSVMELVPESCGISMVESSTSLEAVGNRSEHSISIDISSSLNDLEARNFYPRVDLIPYVRRGKKRKNLQEQAATCEDGSVCFVRSPCEGLRPRTQIKYNVEVDIFAPEKKCTRLERRLGNSDKIEDKCKSFKCDIEGCFMSFGTKGDLTRHKRNRCTIGGCGKTFSSHKYAIRHQCVHQDDRPLKCPWQGCNMTFKWTWARTEHVRVHTGERPYKCSSPGCGQTFRFVSDFSRHRRKTGHYAATSAG